MTTKTTAKGIDQFFNFDFSFFIVLKNEFDDTKIAKLAEKGKELYIIFLKFTTVSFIRIKKKKQTHICRPWTGKKGKSELN